MPAPFSEKSGLPTQVRLEASSCNSNYPLVISVSYQAGEDHNRWTLYMDPAMSIILVCIMIFTTIPLFKQSSMILLQTVPKHIKLTSIREK